MTHRSLTVLTYGISSPPVSQTPSEPFFLLRLTMADPSSLENIDSDQKPETNRVARPQYSTLTVDSERISEAERQGTRGVK